MKKIISIIVCLAVISVTVTGCQNIFSQQYDIEEINNKVIAGNTQFAFDIFKQLNKEDEDKSVFISPLSISTALSMTYQGAGGNTKDEMSETLNYKDIDLQVINDTYKNHLRYLNQVDNKVKLKINNSIWMKEDKDINEDFLSVNKEIFNAYVEALDFSNDEAAEKINNWIDDATNGKISKMIDSPIPPQVIMYLINAIYFKGEWVEEFDEKNTFDGEFYAGDGSSQNAMMMNKKDEVEYGQGTDFKAVRLPYGNGKTAMYCVLPQNGTNINDFIENMDLQKWNEIKDSIQEHDDVILQIPRFKLEYGVKNLNDSLIALGMNDAFDFNADFSGITAGIQISRVLHKAVIEVNEQGTEAAGVTVVEMTESAQIKDPLEFIADRPFLFMIEENETETILFMGKLYNIKN